MRKFKKTVLSLCREMIDKEEDLKEFTTTDAGTPGYEIPHAFSKKRKKKKEIEEALDKKDLDLITKLIRDVVGDIYRDIWLKRTSWK